MLDADAAYVTAKLLYGIYGRVCCHCGLPFQYPHIRGDGRALCRACDGIIVNEYFKAGAPCEFYEFTRLYLEQKGI